MIEAKPKRKSLFHKRLGKSLEESIKAVENHSNNMRFEVIALQRIETDPQNPRELKISMNDVYNGINPSEPFYIEKQQELQELSSLSETIKSKGIINPVVVYKHGQFYRLVAGERRFLASILAKKEDIQAKILPSMPTALNLRILQWIENTERESLLLRDRLGNIKSILDEYQKENPNIEFTAAVLKNLLGVSSSQAANYVSLLRAPSDIKEHILIGKINNIDKAVFLSGIKEDSLRQDAIKACISGESLTDIKNTVQIKAPQRKNTMDIKIKKLGRGRAFKQVNLGKTINTLVVKKIINDVLLQTPNLKYFEEILPSIDWNSYDDTTKVFHQFLMLLEKEGY